MSDCDLPTWRRTVTDRKDTSLGSTSASITKMYLASHEEETTSSTMEHLARKRLVQNHALLN